MENINDFQKVPKGASDKLRIWYLAQLKKGNRNFFKPDFEKKEVNMDTYIKESGRKL